jgi:hypothetical protein
MRLPFVKDPRAYSIISIAWSYCSMPHVHSRTSAIMNPISTGGSYIGTEDEILLSGNLRELMHDIERIRTEARERNGWIMDTYLLRKTEKQ